MSHISDKTVLVVEDEDEISENMNALLLRKGYHVLNAVDAEGAIRIAEQSRPAMILTDLDLPTLVQLMEKLRRHDGLKHLPVAVIDINGPKNTMRDINILNNFEELDELVSAQSHGDILS